MRKGILARVLDWSWSWRFVDREHVQVGADVRLWPVNRPMVRVWRDGDGEGRALLLVSLQYGNGNSDPVFSFDVGLTDPRPVAPRSRTGPSADTEQPMAALHGKGRADG